MTPTAASGFFFLNKQLITAKEKTNRVEGLSFPKFFSCVHFNNLLRESQGEGRKGRRSQQQNVIYSAGKK